MTLVKFQSALGLMRRTRVCHHFGVAPDTCHCKNGSMETYVLSLNALVNCQMILSFVLVMASVSNLMNVVVMQVMLIPSVICQCVTTYWPMILEFAVREENVLHATNVAVISVSMVTIVNC